MQSVHDSRMPCKERKVTSWQRHEGKTKRGKEMGWEGKRWDERASLVLLVLPLTHLASFLHNFFIYKPIQPKLQAYKQDIYVYISIYEYIFIYIAIYLILVLYSCKWKSYKSFKNSKTQNSEKFFSSFLVSFAALATLKAQFDLQIQHIHINIYTHI